MPPRPFPYPLRIGNDICQVARIRALIAGDSATATASATANSAKLLSRFLRRILTPPERAYFWSRFGPQDEIPNKLGSISQFLAGRFAAKEACRKACPHFSRHTRGFQQIIILPVTQSLDDGQTAEPGASARPQGLILDSGCWPQDICSHGGERETAAATATAAGTPSLPCDASALDMLDGQLCEVSISHEDGYATAVALVPAREAPVGLPAYS